MVMRSGYTGSLDDLIAAHDAYVAGCERRLLLAPPADPLVRAQEFKQTTVQDLF